MDSTKFQCRKPRHLLHDIYRKSNVRIAMLANDRLMVEVEAKMTYDENLKNVVLFVLHLVQFSKFVRLLLEKSY